MGKIFLLLIAVGAVVAGFKLWGSWSHTFHPSVPKRDQIAPDQTSSTPKPVKQSSPSDVKAPDKLAWSAISDDWIILPGEGVVGRGDVICGGFVVISWDSAGAFLLSAGKQIRVRWERAGEALSRVTKELEKAKAVVTASDLNPLNQSSFGQKPTSE